MGNADLERTTQGRDRTSPSKTAEIGRKHPVHQPVFERHGVPIIVFLTVCTKDRKKILANDQAHLLLLKAWDAANEWMIGRYVIMPDHIHLFCAPADLNPQPLSRWMNYWKSFAARRWPVPGEAPIWQRHFWDTQLRRGENYDAKWDYVEQNPLRAGLVESVEDWPHQGELNVLRW